MSNAADRIPGLFGSMVFNEVTMAQYVEPDAFESWKRCLRDGEPLSLHTADRIAAGMKQWALERGATHFTHRFHPLSGTSAEKHDSFLTPAGGGRVIMEFSGRELISGEPDASSFPSGGLRATFEARGYSAWDPSSYAYIKDGSLCIPTVFCSYSGAALDKKTPLLRSMDALNRQALRVLRLFGDTETKKVIPQVGAEQEFFLLDKEVFLQREDLRLCGRTLFGARPPKGQELEDHYFGTIKPRVSAYMHDLDEELWKLGIYTRTKHNEAAPSQHEVAPIYTDANTANDQNQLTMELMKTVADRHGLVCLLHEKPFARVNGSGKHDNWSLATDRGENLFSPGNTPSRNARFLLFLAAFLQGVDEYQELLRSSIASAGNDCRLGGQEAPPSILSVFLGDELQRVTEDLIAESSHVDSAKRVLRIGVDMLPAIPQDNTDRNRTAPIAFTGNKFEFRMPGSSQSIAGPTTMLNAVMAEELGRFADILEQAEDFSAALHDVIRNSLASHSRILFLGNCYDEGWIAEAARRGLANLKDCAEALPCYLLPKNIGLLTRQGVYTREEMLARHEIHMEKYCKLLSIEASTLIDMVRRGVTGAVSAYIAALSDSLLKQQSLGLEISGCPELRLLGLLRDSLRALCEETDALAEALRRCGSLPVNEAALLVFRDEIAGGMARMREQLDLLEANTAQEYWPFPNYFALLFSV